MVLLPKIGFNNLHEVKFIKNNHQLKDFLELPNKLNIFHYLCIYSLKHDTPIL